MNEINITINGIRYEAVDLPSDLLQLTGCEVCDLSEECDVSDFTTFCARHVSETDTSKR